MRLWTAALLLCLAGCSAPPRPTEPDLTAVSSARGSAIAAAEASTQPAEIRIVLTLLGMGATVPGAPPTESRLPGTLPPAAARLARELLQSGEVGVLYHPTLHTRYGEWGTIDLGGPRFEELRAEHHGERSAVVDLVFRWDDGAAARSDPAATGVRALVEDRSAGVVAFTAPTPWGERTFVAILTVEEMNAAAVRSR